MREMTPALAGKIAVTVILIILFYGLLILAVGRFLRWLSKKYPRVSSSHAEYYGVEPYSESDDNEPFHLDENEQPHPPTRAA